MIRDYIDRILNTEAAQDLLDEIVAMELANVYENAKPENAITEEDRHDFITIQAAARVLHNYFTTPDRHIP